LAEKSRNLFVPGFLARGRVVKVSLGALEEHEVARLRRRSRKIENKVNTT
jgi:hypothetical protein